MKHSISSALFFLLAASPAIAGPAQESAGLRKIRATFDQADRNSDGQLDPAEAKRATIPSADFVSQDHDGDRKLSEDEFLLYYKQLLVGAEQAIDADVNREAARIEEARRKQAAEEAKRREAEAERLERAKSERGGKPGLSKTVSEKLQRAEAALDAMVARGDLTKEQADAKREVLHRRAEEVSGRSRSSARKSQNGAEQVDVEKRFRRAEDAVRKSSGEGDLSRAEAQEKQAKLAERARAAQADLSPSERQKLSAELDKLDVELAAGRITKPEYEKQRTAMIERAQRAGKAGEAKPQTGGVSDEQQRARGEAARKKHQAERAEAEKRQKERGEAARRQHQEAEKQRVESERREAEKAGAEKRAAEKRAAEKRAAEKRAAEKKAAEKKKAEERREQHERDVEDARLRKQERKRRAEQNGGRKQP